VVGAAEVVGVVVLGVVVVAGLAAEADAEADDAPAEDAGDDCPDTVVGMVLVGLGLVEDPGVVAVTGVVTADEWAVVSEATRTPRPTVPAAAAIPIDVVTRRTRCLARSLDRAA
jgi:hypothetical protein